jgi:hypothetical protein
MCFYIVKYFVNVSLDKCVRNPCAKSQMCWTDKDGSATCICPPGFAGEDCSGKGILMGNVPHPVLLSDTISLKSNLPFFAHHPALTIRVKTFMRVLALYT